MIIKLFLFVIAVTLLYHHLIFLFFILKESSNIFNNLIFVLICKGITDTKVVI